jgi:phosphopantothenoylcysteine decarboxylase / phosphopantothenate---cysteine ligase
MAEAERPPLPLDSKHIVLGVAGSIASYKAADLASKLRQAGASVEVVMTEAATKFVTSLTFQSLTGRDVVVDMFGSAEAEAHVEVARRADAMVIAPATANCMAELASGATRNMVTLTALATAAPTLLAPAMDNQMWENPATQANVSTLAGRGFTFVGPGEGRLATGRIGRGRMAEVPQIIGAVRAMLSRGGDLAGRHIVVSAGGTQEPLDPVRFIGNRSSGKMGFAIAEAARDRGALVTLVTGPVPLPSPYGVERVDVSTVSEMSSALRDATASCDGIIMAAAPADFAPAATADQKIKKETGNSTVSVELTKTEDIIASLEGGGVRIGFAAETTDHEANAKAKLKRKHLDYIALNDVTAAGSGFGTETNQITVFGADGSVERMPLLSKYEVAHRLLDLVAKAY